MIQYFNLVLNYRLLLFHSYCRNQLEAIYEQLNLILTKFKQSCLYIVKAQARTICIVSAVSFRVPVYYFFQFKFVLLFEPNVCM